MSSTEPHAPHDCGTCCEARGCDPDVFTVTHEPLEALTAICGTCGGADQVVWCPSWDAWLCAICRSTRNDAELRVPLVVKNAIRATEESERCA